MGKKAEKNTMIHSPNSVAVEQTSIYDDSLLPPAEELAKLKQVDPTSIEWIKRRTEIEQDARIRFNDAKVSIVKKEMNYNLLQNIMGMVMAFIIIIITMSLSAYFIYKGLSIEGTIFGGTSIVFALLIFAKFRPSNPPDKEQ